MDHDRKDLPHPDPLHKMERGSESGVKGPAPKLWEKLKPLAREMRHAPTPAEAVLWQHLRDRRLGGCKFRRQHAIDRFIVDFYCPSASLVIEIDGPIHDVQSNEDAIRQQFIEARGLHVLRFTNDQVLTSINFVLAEINKKLAA